LGCGVEPTIRLDRVFVDVFLPTTEGFLLDFQKRGRSADHGREAGSSLLGTLLGERVSDLHPCNALVSRDPADVNSKIRSRIEESQEVSPELDGGELCRMRLPAEDDLQGRRTVGEDVDPRDMGSLGEPAVEEGGGVRESEHFRIKRGTLSGEGD